MHPEALFAMVLVTVAIIYAYIGGYTKGRKDEREGKPGIDADEVPEIGE